MNLVGVLSNPASTRNREGLTELRETVDAFNGVFHFEIASIDEVSLALQRFAERGVDIIAVNGGDGTIQAVFTCLLTERPFAHIPPIAVLPAGKTNMIAEDLGALQPRPSVYLRELLAVIRDRELSNHMAKRHILRVTGVPGQPDLYGMFFGTAGIVKGIELCRRIVYPLGLPNAVSHPLAITIMLFGTIFGGLIGRSPLATSPLTLREPDGTARTGQFFVVTLTTLDRLILGLRPVGTVGHGALRLLSVAQRPLAVLKGFWQSLWGNIRHEPDKGITSQCVEALELELSCPITLDGELYEFPEQTTIEVSAAEELTFITF